METCLNKSCESQCFPFLPVDSMAHIINHTLRFVCGRTNTGGLRCLISLLHLCYYWFHWGGTDGQRQRGRDRDIPATCMQCSRRPETVIRSPETRVPDGRELPTWSLNSSLVEQPVLLAAQPSLQSLTSAILYHQYNIPHRGGTLPPLV